MAVMDPKDAQLSIAILNPATAALQGELAYARAMGRFTGSEKAIRLVGDLTKVLDDVRTWWKDLAAGAPLARRVGDSAEITADGKRVCELLEAAVERWARLAERVEALGELPSAGDGLRLAAAANLDQAFYAHQIIAGTIAAGRMLGDPTVGGRLAGRIAQGEGEMKLGNELVDALAARGKLGKDDRTVLAERLLTLPVDLRLRAVDGRCALGNASGRLDHRQAGIPDDEAVEWRRLGVPPPIAAQWRAAGFRPAEAFEWARKRFDPATAASFRLRGVSLEEAILRSTQR